MILAAGIIFTYTKQDENNKSANRKIVDLQSQLKTLNDTNNAAKKRLGIVTFICKDIVRNSLTIALGIFL